MTGRGRPRAAGGATERDAIRRHWRHRLDYCRNGGDAAHLRTFRAEYGKRARAGLLLHTVNEIEGNEIEWLAPDVLAAPWWTVL